MAVALYTPFSKATGQGGGGGGGQKEGQGEEGRGDKEEGEGYLLRGVVMLVAHLLVCLDAWIVTLVFLIPWRGRGGQREG